MSQFTPESTPNFTQLADLAAPRLGGRVLEANDDFFAPKENLLKESKPVFIEGKIHRAGKMDGRLGNAPPLHPRLRLVHR